MSDLPRVVAESDVGTIAVVEIWRKNKTIDIKVKLGELPEKIYVERKESNTQDKEELEIINLGLTILQTQDNEGVIVSKILNNESKLLEKDVIIEINREKISNPTEFKTLVDEIQKTGRTSLLLKIVRNKETLWVTIKFLDN